MNTNNSAESEGAAILPVLIAGGGPVGLSLAIELGLRGIECVLAEKRDGSVPVPKMSGVSTRAMEFCRRWGIAEDVKSAVWLAAQRLDFVYMTSLVGYELARMRLPYDARKSETGFSPEGPCLCPQIFFDPILVARVRTLPSVEIRTNTTVKNFTQDADAVHAVMQDSQTGKTETLSARYLIGCDGPGGVVREALGIELGGLGRVAHSVNIFFRAPELASLHDKGWARIYRAIDKTGCWSELMSIDGRELWRLTVFRAASGDFDAGASLRRAIGADFAYELISVLPWERNDCVAQSYGIGRVLIAGDAAHQCSPTGGLGMHMGIGEAVNLAWKLAAVIEGWGGPRLLDSYEAECRPIALRNVGLATHNFQEITSIPAIAAIAEDSADGERERQNFAGTIPQLGRFTVSEYVKTQYCYEGSPICLAEGRDREPTIEDAHDLRHFVPSAKPGTRAPNGWIAEGRSTLDLFGDGFVLLQLGANPADAAAIVEAAAARGLPLRLHAIADQAIADLYERRLVLVRPDGHVAWRGNACSGDATALIETVRGAGPSGG